MKDLLVKDVRRGDRPEKPAVDILIRNGTIAEIGPALAVHGVPTICGGGRTALPSFVDLHAHFRDPGFPEKEDLESGSCAAVHGGFTAVSLMANTDPVCDRAEVAESIVDKARKIGRVEIFLVGALTQGLAGEKLADLHGLAPYVWAFSDDGRGVERHDLMAQAGQVAQQLGKVLMPHPEFPGLPPPLGEELMVARDLWLCHRLGFRLHLTHLSAPGSFFLAGLAKSHGLPVTCDVTPHHLCVSKDEASYTVNPPLVGRDAQEHMLREVKNGRVEALATDHAPHTLQAKADGAPGISGIETAFSLLYTRLVRGGNISLCELSCLLSLGPARILGLRKGRVEDGYDGDLVLAEEDEAFVASEGFFLSKGKNTPILGTPLWGKIFATVHRGEVVYLDGQIKGRDFDDQRQVVRSC